MKRVAVATIGCSVALILGCGGVADGLAEGLEEAAGDLACEALREENNSPEERAFWEEAAEIEDRLVCAHPKARNVRLTHEAPVVGTCTFSEGKLSFTMSMDSKAQWDAPFMEDEVTEFTTEWNLTIPIDSERASGDVKVDITRNSSLMEPRPGCDFGKRVPYE